MKGSGHRQESKYQPEFDGLRAIAVLGVLLYHVGFEHVSGGFVGVDVFFVISGFLITRLIVTEVQDTGRFSFARFYVRRLRRLAPALVATVTCTFIFAFLLLSPEQMTDFVGSAATAVLSTSNFYFWWNADYFDALAVTKPLLHTWSLSVEEQYYLIWPALVVLLSRYGRSALVWAVVSLLLTSLALAEYQLTTNPSAAFYLLPFRAFELAIGALMVWVNADPKTPPRTGDGIALLGIVLVLHPMLTYTEDTPFPGLSALLPCLGTAMIIYALNARVSGWILRNPLAVWVGRISYSLYLVHWPILVFFYSYTYSLPESWQRWAIVLVSFMLGWLQYRVVEERFRYARSEGWSGARISAAVGACVTILVATSLYGISTGGFPERLPERRMMPTVKEWRTQQNETYCQRVDAAKDPSLVTCQNDRGAARDLFIWGDSHALHLAPGFSEVYPEFNVFVLYMSGCVPQSGFAGYVRDFRSENTAKCAERNRAALDYFLAQEPTNILLTGAKRSSPATIARATKEIVEPLLERGHNVIVLGDFIRPGQPLNDCVAVPAFLITDAQLKSRCTGISRIARRELNYNVELLEHYPQAIIPNAIQCPDGRCIFHEGGRLLYADHHHLNFDGAIYFVNALKPLLPL